MTALPPPAPRGDAPLTRRALGLGAIAIGTLGSIPVRASEGATILAPGPEDGGCARWAARAGQALARGMQRPGTIRLALLGGPDGVTAANRFATLDGTGGPSLLALPGWTCHARLTGSPRARFEPRAWVPLLLSWRGAVLAGRGPLPGRGSAPLRVAMPSAEAPEAAALAALDLLGLTALPLVGMPEAAFAAGETDALIVLGPDPLTRAQAMGATPWYGFPGPSETERVEIAPFPLSAPLARAVVAAVAAMQIQAALFAPVLSAADSLAAWRMAAPRWQEEERATSRDDQPLVGTSAAEAFALLTPPPDAVLDYRNWLDRRLGWRAG
ncbi:hypothetical protein D9599_01905 [Roseomonas sp. KE2513]|uniref:hypothetical protein n=1 Tax=Roseomonas sp. KE2513 TaxID=2479202 RepID=UPI0018E02F8B|nr:hypothetical protein [Roseomonas sp. KE2513]MBI0534327.1 hypothetical protein [Roseomonas sp. KE2513]